MVPQSLITCESNCLMIRLPFLLSTTVALFAGVSSLTAADPPNVLILYADDLGFGDLGCYHADSRIPTPHLNQLASEGIRFTDGHSSSGICTPSRYALLTGRHHWRDFHNIVGALGGSVFDPERLTLPEMMREQGYQTAAIGKWHLGWDWDAIRKPDARKIGKGKAAAWGPDAFDWNMAIPNGPLAHGFDSYFGDTVINFPPYAWIENDRLTKAPDALMDSSKWPPIKEGRWECRPGPMVSGWNPYDNIPTTTQKGVDFIKRQTSSDAPFFLYFAFPSPHAPIIPNDEFDGASKAGPYGDFVVETDAAVGKILAALESSGQAENTIVIFTADNGPERYAYARDKEYGHWSAHPLRGLKRDIYEGGHHVPFIIRWPGVATSGRVSSALVSQIDIMATLAAVTGFHLPDDAAEDSHNLVPLLKGDADAVRTTHIHNTRANHYAIRHHDWLLIDARTGYISSRNAEWEAKRNIPADNDHPVELYNLKDDIGQTKDVSLQHPDVVEDLQQLLRSIREKGFSSPRLKSKR